MAAILRALTSENLLLLVIGFCTTFTVINTILLNYWVSISTDDAIATDKATLHIHIMPTFLLVNDCQSIYR